MQLLHHPPRPTLFTNSHTFQHPQQFQFVSENFPSALSAPVTCAASDLTTAGATSSKRVADAEIHPPAKRQATGSQKRKDLPKSKAPTTKKKKAAPIDRVLPTEVDVSKHAPKVVQKRAKDATHDVLTVFRKVDPEDDEKGHTCEICT